MSYSKHNLLSTGNILILKFVINCRRLWIFCFILLLVFQSDLYYFVVMNTALKSSISHGIGGGLGYTKSGRLGSYLLAAGLVTGVHWYIQSRLAWA